MVLTYAPAATHARLTRHREKLVDAGFESGHAYGKALRTVKSCVGSTWCRYGMSDAIGVAVRLENRYKGEAVTSISMWLCATSLARHTSACHICKAIAPLSPAVCSIIL
jgi:NAD(P)H-nitrite reductase large subunit